METRRKSGPATEDQQPPFGTWTLWYATVLLTLAFLIILFYAFTRAFE